MVRQLSLFLVIVLVAASFAAAQDEKKEDDKPDFKQGDAVQISVLKTFVREKPRALAKVIGTLTHADPVTVEETFGKGWAKVANAEMKLAGWLRSSAITKGKIKKLKAGEGSTGAQGEETSMAGKGVDDATQVYINKNNLSAAAAIVDDIARRPYTELSIEQVIAFIQATDLKPKGSV